MNARVKSPVTKLKQSQRVCRHGIIVGTRLTIETRSHYWWFGKVVMATHQQMGNHNARTTTIVIPAEAGIQWHESAFSLN